MKILLYIFVIIISTYITYYIDQKNYLIYKTPGRKIKLFFKDFFLINLLTPSILVLFNYKNVFIANEQEYLFFFIYFIISILVSFAYFLTKLIINKKYTFEKSNKKKYSTLIYSMAVFLFFVSIFVLTGTVWVKNTYNNAKFDQIITTILSPTAGTDPTIFYAFIEQSLLISVSLTYLFALIFHNKISYRSVKSERIIYSEMGTRVTILIISFCLLAVSFFYGAWRFDLRSIIISYTQSSPYIENNYVDPMDVKLDFPSKKRNLIHIYLESVENSYFDKENGGNMDENYMPNILELSKEGYSFSHLDENKGKGGALETPGCTWSVASMINQFFGIPMKAPAKNNAYGKKGQFIPGAVGVGDILNKLGYNQTMMIGADAEFGGLSYMFSDHGNFKIMDHQYALKNGLIPNGYDVNWGYEDEKLYEFAKNELTRLASLDKPFHFLMENADTHVPGFAFEGDNPVFDKPNLKKDYGKTIKFSEKHVAEFIRWIQQQPFYENTTVIIIGDHLSMEKKFFTEHNFLNYTRTTFNLILNPINTLKINKDRLYNRKWANFDMMPTLLASIGVKIEGNKLGLGTNLFSNEKTIFERDGYKYVTEEFIKKSPYYNDRFLNSKIHYEGDNLHFY